MLSVLFTIFYFYLKKRRIEWMFRGIFHENLEEDSSRFCNQLLHATFPFSFSQGKSVSSRIPMEISRERTIPCPDGSVRILFERILLHRTSNSRQPIVILSSKLSKLFVAPFLGIFPSRRYTSISIPEYNVEKPRVVLAGSTWSRWIDWQRFNRLVNKTYVPDRFLRCLDK